MQATARRSEDAKTRTTKDRSEERVEGAFTFADLSRFTFKQRLIIYIADLFFYFLIRALGLTTRFEVEGWENHEAIESASHIPIYTSWHQGIFLSTYFWRNRRIAVMSSLSFDSQYIARFIQRFGYGVARGSSTRAAIKATIELVRLMRAGGCPAGFTIDGPTGPPRVAKMGAVIIAKKTGNPILPFAIEPARLWQIKSWDRMHIPKPFTRARVLIGKPIYVVANADDEAMEEKRDELQKALDELTARGEEWRQEQKG
jgi:hypothetical protein